MREGVVFESKLIIRKPGSSQALREDDYEMPWTGQPVLETGSCF